MFDLIAEMLTLGFMRRAFLVGALVSVCAALIGVSLVLKRYSMIGDGLSHVGFGALALATALGWAPMAVAVPVMLAAAFLLLRLSDNGKVKGDAAIAMVATGSLALGVIVLSLSSGMTADVGNYLFGNILAVKESDVLPSVLFGSAVLALFGLFYRKIFSITFDETFARAVGERTSLYNMLLAFLTAVTVALGMRLMGAMLISSLVVFPSLAAMRICRSFRGVTIVTAIIALVCFCAGLTASFVLSTPPGASVVLANIITFLLFWGMERFRERA